MKLTSEQKAQKIIESEFEAKTGVLNLHGLDLKELPETIQEMTWLKILNLGRYQYWDTEAEKWKHTIHDIDMDPFYIQAIFTFLEQSKVLAKDAARLPDWLCTLEGLEQLSVADSKFLMPNSNLENLSFVFLDNTPADIKPITALASLQRVSMNNVLIEDVSFLSDLPNLHQIDFAGTGIKTLSTLSTLSNLEHINLNNTQVLDLSPLSNLCSLQKIYLNDTHVADLNPLSGLPSLQDISLGHTQVSDLRPLSGLSSLKRIRLYGTQVSDLRPLSHLSSLQAVQLENTQVSDLSPLSGLSSLQQIHLSSTQVSGLSGLSGLPNLQEISLHGTQVSDLSPLSGLSSLQQLYLDSTQVSNLSPLSGLFSLQKIHLNRTQVSDLSPLSGLFNLNQLNLENTKVSDLSPLSGLSSLRRLILANTQVSDLSPLSGLSSLQQLILASTQVSDLSPLSGLSSLQQLYLDGTKVSDLSSLSGLSNLQEIGLDNTQVSDLSPLADLSNLQEIDLDNTEISDLSPISKLSKLQQIRLSSTKVLDLSPLSGLSNLEVISLDGTKVPDLAPLSSLHKLNGISCRKTLISDLSKIYPQLKSGVSIDVRDCPLFIPPVEFSEKGTESIVEYFDQLNEEASSLNEIKIILLGEGTAGKTSLVRRLQGENFNPDEGKTHGIRIREEGFDIADESVTARIWDFGGQETMHATHQFFLSERCIYVLVLNGRQGDDRNRVEYWLKHARSYGGDSPVLVVMNKIDEDPAFEVDRKFLSEKYPQIQGYHRLSCSTGIGVDEFKKGLMKEIECSKSRKTPFPKAWSQVKNHFDGLNQDYINSSAYQQICHEYHIDKALSQNVLLNFLHDLGVLVNFDKLLQYCDMQILNPLWLTNGVYRVMNSTTVAGAKGILRRDELDQVINQEEQLADNTLEEPILYEKDKLPIIIEVMQKFELCYQLDSAHYVIPSLLAKQEPEFSFEGALIHFEVHFDEFLPPSLFPRLMVKLHSYIEGNNNWRSGMILYKPEIVKARARVRVDREDRKLVIHCCGEEPRRFLSFIRKTIEEIAGEFSLLDYVEKVAIPHDEKKLVFKDYEDLVIHEQEGEETIFVSELRKRVSVKDILDGVEDPLMRDKQAQTPVKAFISYSHKDKDGLEALLSALSMAKRVGNLTLWYDKAIDAGKEWEKTIFEELNNSDIVLCLVSADFINSDFCDRELNNALNRHKQGKQKVIPVQWRSCHWDNLPISQLQGLVNESIKSLPENEQDLAWTEAAKKLDPIIEEARKDLLQRKNKHDQEF